MTQQKSPGSGNNQGVNKKKKDGMDYSYPLAVAAVNPKCPRCLYHRAPATALRLPFCTFTGEPITPASMEVACTFWTPTGGDTA